MYNLICFYQMILLSAANKFLDTVRDFTLDHLEAIKSQTESRILFAVDFTRYVVKSPGKSK